MEILVIDNDVKIQSLICNSFKDEIKSHLFNFYYAYTSEEALSYIAIRQGLNIDLLLLFAGVHLRSIFDVELIKIIKTKYPHLRIITIKIYGDKEHFQEPIINGADDSIKTPVDLSVLKNKLFMLLPEKKNMQTFTSFNQQAIDLQSLSHYENISSGVHPVKILVVDDEQLFKAVINKKFKKAIMDREFIFFFANNGKEALDILSADLEIGIVLTDIKMPVMDGLTLLAQMNQQNRLYRTVVISAYSDMNNIRAAMNLGANDFITKPIDLNDLEITVRNLIDQYFLLKEGIIAQKKVIEFNNELNIAKKIQQSFTPHHFTPFPDNKKISILGETIPASVLGGDFFDFFPIDPNHLAIVIGDVAGKDIAAALFMAMCRAFIRAINSTSSLSTQSCVQQVNKLLYKDNELAMFVAVFYGVFNLETGELAYTNAGHHSSYILSNNGDLTTIGEEEGIVLGICDESERGINVYQEKKVFLKDGDILILYTDGVTEATNINHEFFTQKRFEGLLKANAGKTIDELISAIKNEVKNFSGPKEQSDDITILCLQYHKD